MGSILKRFKGIADVYIVSSKNKLLLSYQADLAGYDLNIEFRHQENRGRNEAAYFITCKDVWKKYEYVCALHDKKNLACEFIFNW